MNANKNTEVKFMPELLSPAGSPDSLCAAVYGGANAVYFGGSAANARASAKNFADAELAAAIKFLHDHNKLAYITLNTLHTDREIHNSSLLKFVDFCCSHGVDAFILQDIGLSKIIRNYFPNIRLHASTQMAGHNLNSAEEAAKLGFSRMVVSRETDKFNLKHLIDTSTIEIEIFVHGALCSSHSGRCFMSFALGNTRSANRGMCAQPCRMPMKMDGIYRSGKNANGYLLSLKDLCLAQHIEEIIELSPASLKIEGRMKPPEYVYYVTKLYRTCIDERRNATKKEVDFLSQVFSRQGFTDGYFTKRLSVSMYGVRTEQNKEQSKNIQKYAYIDFNLQKFRSNINTHTVSNISKNEREAYADIFIEPKRHVNSNSEPKLCLNFEQLSQFYAVSKFLLRDEIYNKIYKIFIPIRDLTGNINNIEMIDEKLRKMLGIRFPYVFFDSEENAVRKQSQVALKCNIKTALVDNIGHIKTAKDAGFEVFGNHGLNITNSYTIDELEKMGISSAILSTELNFAQIRDIRKPINCGIIGYGKTHIMISENCLIKNSELCSINRNDKAEKNNTENLKCKDFACHYISDRLGKKFAVKGDSGHRNIIFNSVPVYLADKKNLYKNLGLFFIALNFTDEKKDDIIKIIGDYAMKQQDITPPMNFTRGYK